jgi:poly-gamma-glutamate synthesis protein (capsule biosynthesis protein)
MKKRKILGLSLILLFLPLFFGGVIFYLTKISNTETEKKQPFALLETPKSDTKNEISTLIVPHHDLVAKERRDLFTLAKGKTSSTKTVILVSTNHFDTGSSQIITSLDRWNLANGQIFANEPIVSALIEESLAANEPGAFANEHGVRNILRDIKDNYQEAKIVPIIIKPGTSDSKIEALSTRIHTLCDIDCLLIASVDFSHYQPASLAELHDDMTIRALSELDQSKIKKAETDSPETLLLAAKWAISRETLKFSLQNHTNSGVLAKSRDLETTTHLFAWYEKGERFGAPTEFNFMVGGDMMFDRNINYTFPYNKIYDAWSNFGERVFWGTDLSIANLEGPISPTEMPPVKSLTMNFNFPPKTVDVLYWLKLDAVSLANNHTYNNGQSGFANTKKVLADKGINFVGKQEGFDEDSVSVFDNGKMKMAVVAIDILAISANLVPTIQELKAQGCLVMIMPHWGIEYEPIHSPAQERLAHTWIDAGADLVVGGHPHVVQDAEIYKNRPIFYSLGNLLFDQDWSIPTQKGLIIAGKITDKETTLVLLPTVSKKSKPELASGEEKTRAITSLRQGLGLPISDIGLFYDKIIINKR